MITAPLFDLIHGCLGKDWVGNGGRAFLRHWEGMQDNSVTCIKESLLRLSLIHLKLLTLLIDFIFDSRIWWFSVSNAFFRSVKTGARVKFVLGSRVTMSRSSQVPLPQSEAVLVFMQDLIFSEVQRQMVVN